jgi:Ca-activated chloride channel family protein
MRRLILGLAIALGCAAQELPSIRVDVRLINVAFTVRDASGAFVTNLSKDDFEVIDDGVPQAISFFARSADLPLTLGLILDVSGSQEHFMKRHEHDLGTFLKSVLTPRDNAFLEMFRQSSASVSDFSPAVNELDGRVERFRSRPAQASGNRTVETSRLPARRSMMLCIATTEKLAKAESGRRALIVFSDGEDNSSAIICWMQWKRRKWKTS